MVQTVKIFDNVSITDKQSKVSAAYDIAKKDGYFSIQVEVTAGGQATINYESSLDGVNFLTPTDELPIAVVTPTSGPGQNGKDIYSFSPLLCSNIRLRVSAVGNVTLSVTLAMQ